MNVFGQAGILMAYGLAVVFGALFLFYGCIVLLGKLGSRKEKESGANE